MGSNLQQQQRPMPEQQNAGYRAQRVSGAFGDPIIAQMMAALQSMAGGPNVQGQMFQGGGFAAGGGPGGSPVSVDPVVARILEMLRGPNPSLARESQHPNTGTTPVIEPVPQNAPPNTSTVPPENLPSTGPSPMPMPAMENPFAQMLPPWLTAQLMGPEAGMAGGPQGPQGPQVSPNFEANMPGSPNVA